MRRSDNLLEPSGPVEVCSGIALPLPLHLCKRTAAKLTSEESINKGNLFGSCWCPKVSVTEPT